LTIINGGESNFPVRHARFADEAQATPVTTFPGAAW